MKPPSLVSLCVVALLPYADSLDVLYPHRLCLSRSLLAELIDVDEQIDPRLWAVLVQIFDGLPEELRASLEADLADPRIEVVLRVRTTPSFELLTVVELPGCKHLTDDAVAKLFRGMHSLAAIDASDTTLSAYAIQSLACALDDERGPWKLSVLFLRNCKSVTNDIYAHLTAFPLLSVVDLSATLCSFDRNAPFKLSTEDALFHPTPILTILFSVHNGSKFSALHISSFSRPTPPPPPKSSTAARASQDSFVVFSSSQLQFGNTNTLAFDEESTILTPTFKIPVKVPRLPPPTPSLSTSSFYQPLPNSHAHRRRPTNLRLARPPPPDPHIALKTAQLLHTQLRHQNRALRSNLDPDALGAEIDQSSDRAKRARIALDEVLRRRMESTHDSSSTTVDILRRPSQERLASRNPFRRSCSSGAAGAGDPTAKPPQAGPLVRSLKVHVSNSNLNSTLQQLLPPPSQPKPTLKPISSLKPPSLPPELRSSNLAASSSALRSEKRRVGLPSLRKRSRADTDDDNEDGGDVEAKAKGPPAKPRMRMGLGSASSSSDSRPKQKGKPTGTSSISKTHQQPQGFDWKAWSCGRPGS